MRKKKKKKKKKICKGVKHGLSHQGNNVDWGCLRTGCWGEYLDQTGWNLRQHGEACKIRSFVTFTLHQILQGHQEQVAKVGGACSTHGRDEKSIWKFGQKTWRWDHSRDLGQDGRIVIRTCVKEIGWEGVDWLRTGGQKRALVNTEMNLEEVPSLAE
jgi:hypothetical protein